VVTELPVPVVDAGYRAGPHHPFELKPAQPRHFDDCLLDRDLHLGQRRNRHPQRQLLVQHVILADVPVSKDMISELLRVPQPGTMASINQAWARSTATWSAMLRAFDGPVSMLIMAMPLEAC
jgi:hypothetical protein